MKLKKILKDILIEAIKGSKEIEINGVTANSKLVVPGNLFVARKGRAEDGGKYIPEAVAGGAAAIVTDIYDPSISHVTQVICRDVGSVEALLSANFYQFPSDELFMVGITGTNGKTTTSFLIKQLLDQIKGPCGLIGTIEYIIGKHRYQATRTTPDVSSNHKMLRDMVKQGCQSAVMEVTSHALDQNRVDYIDYDVAVFTNLTLDHLDYHQSMEDYAEAKRRLFKELGTNAKRKKKYCPTAIVNMDSPWISSIVKGCSAHMLTYGIDSLCDLKAEQIEMSALETSCVLNYRGERQKASWPLVGRFNVYNMMAAIGVGLAYGRPLEQLIEMVRVSASVPGRLEKVGNPLGLNVYVDFAHTPDALVNVLESLQELKKGKILTVFGCGGDRDATKRPKMAQACEQLSDVVIVTSDNPRREQPEEIVRQIMTGFKHPDRHLVEIDRRAAIEKAIDMASRDDIVLIAGKGHETYQIFAHQTIEFDDKKVAAEICESKYALTLV